MPSAYVMPLAVSFCVLAGLLVCVAAFRLRRRVVLEQHGRREAERLLERTSQLETLAAALLKGRTSLAVSEASLAELLPAIGASTAAIALATEDQTELAVVHTVGFPDMAATPPAVPLAWKTLLTEAWRNQDDVIFASRADHHHRSFAHLAADPLFDDCGAAVVLPLLVSDRSLGVVSFGFRRPHTSSAEERQFLASAAQHTAHALDRAVQYEQAQRARANAEAYRERADIELRERQRVEEALRESEVKYRGLAARTNRLYTLSAGLSEAVSLEAIAKVIVRRGKKVAGASSGFVALLVDGAQFETLYTDENPPQNGGAGYRFPAESGLCATAAVESGQAVYVGSFAEWRQHYPRSAAAAADGGYASAAVLPMLVKGSAIGVLSFYFTVPVNFDEDYRALLTSVAQHAAQAVDRARLYEATQQARADAEAANRSKDDFLSIVSHELRTPLSAVLGWASMLRNHTLDASRAPRAIEAIYNNATQQAHLIDELLDVSRIVAGRASLDVRVIDLAESVRGAVETILPVAEAKGVEVCPDLRPGCIYVTADPHRIEQVFVNLLGNAVKFTPPTGRITVQIAASDTSIDVRVSDTGRGIDPAFLPHVFEQFRQADGTIARSAGGLGLGLFIARRLVDGHGGSIRAESEGEGRGATFIVSLPPADHTPATYPLSEKAPSQRDNPHADLPALTGLRVMLVDDDAEVRDVMSSVLSQSGALVTCAASAREALRLLTGGQPINVLLSDIAMPGEDGYELIRQVRALSASVAGLPAAAVTAFAGAEERERALAAGFQMHLAKPLLPETLVNAVARLAEVPTTAD
jgi:signal transduction histidine kinase/ActR/RegA family two-component response regulator